MEEKVLNRKDIPMGYPLCFNSECTKKDCCMHYQARLLMPEGRHYGSEVFPTAWHEDHRHVGNTEGIKFDHYVTEWDFDH